MVLVEPRSGHVANLVKDTVPDLLGKQKHGSLKVRAQEESQEGLILAICVEMKEGVQMRVGSGEGGPVAAGVGSSSLEADTLASGEVDEGTRGVGQAARHSAAASGIS